MAGDRVAGGIAARAVYNDCAARAKGSVHMIQYGAKPNLTITQRVGRELRRNKVLYIMAVPVILYFALFHYGPMYGVILAFKDYRVGEGIWQSPWVGMKHFINFLSACIR